MAEVGQAMQLDFHQAMQDFRTMFPDMDADVIEAVLRANRGAVHATIDQLLTMVTDTDCPNQIVTPTNLLGAPTSDSGRVEGASNYELPPSYSLSATPPPSYHQAVPSPHRSPFRSGQDRSKVPLRVSHNWNPPILLPLPNDFLRVLPTINRTMAAALSPQRLSERLSENAVAREAVGGSDLELVQYLKDERIALFLQNGEFLKELRSNDEFMSALQKDYESEDGDHFETEVGAGKKSTEKKSATNGVIASLDDATLKARIATMGKASRKKFAQIAKVFSRGKRAAGSPRSLLQVGGTNGGKDLLMSPDPLLEDADEEKVSQTSVEESSSTPRKFP